MHSLPDAFTCLLRSTFAADCVGYQDALIHFEGSPQPQLALLSCKSFCRPLPCPSHFLYGNNLKAQGFHQVNLAARQLQLPNSYLAAKLCGITLSMPNQCSYFYIHSGISPRSSMVRYLHTAPEAVTWSSPVILKSEHNRPIGSA